MCANEPRVWIVNKQTNEPMSVALSDYLEYLELTSKVDVVEVTEKTDEEIFIEAIDEIDWSEIDGETVREIRLYQDINTGKILYSETEVDSCECDENGYCMNCADLEMLISMFNHESGACDDDDCEFCS